MSRTHAHQFFIDGAWVAPQSKRTIPVVDPSTEQPLGDVALGSAADVDKAVAAARAAFDAFSQTSVEDRMALLGRIADVYKRRFTEMGQVISAEMGAPTRIKGIRRPMGVRNRSDQAPTGGWMNNAARLSSVIKKPITAGARSKRSARKMGTKAL